MRQGVINKADGRFVVSYHNIEIDVTESVQQFLTEQEAKLREEQDLVTEEVRSQLQRYHSILAIVRGEFKGPIG